MAPAHGFTASLHPLTVAGGVLASASRTPDRCAILEGSHRLSYRELREAMLAGRAPASEAGCTAVTGPLTRAVAGWLADAYARTNISDERAVFIDRPVPLTDRAIVLRLFGIAVSHGSFSRDLVSAVPLQLTRPAGIVAALLPLWLGATLCLFRPGDGPGMAAAISDGQVNQAWLDRDVISELLLAGALPPVPESFQLAVCDGLPEREASARLLAWLGPNRLTAQTGDDVSGAFMRHPGLEPAGEPFVGVFSSAAGEPIGMAAAALPLAAGTLSDAS